MFPNVVFASKLALHERQFAAQLVGSRSLSQTSLFGAAPPELRTPLPHIAQHFPKFPAVGSASKLALHD